MNIQIRNMHKEMMGCCMYRETMTCFRMRFCIGSIAE